MSEYKLIGHETHLEKFVTLYENNELPNKILLSGKKGIGKSLLTEKFLYKIFSSNNDNELIKNKSHPNVLNIKGPILLVSDFSNITAAAASLNIGLEVLSFFEIYFE